MYLPDFHNFLNDQFEQTPDDDTTIGKANVLMLNILNTKKEDQINENFKMFYESVSKISNGDVAKIYLYLHNNIFAKLSHRILESQFPGLTSKSIEALESAIGKEFITNMQDKINKNQNMNKAVSVLGRIIKMEFHLLDLVKDLCFAISLLGLIGNVTVLWSFYNKFTSVMVWIFFSSIIIPLLLSTIDLTIYSPGMIFNIEDDVFRKMSVTRKFFLVLGNFLLCIINPILLINCCEAMKDKLRTYAKVQDIEKTAQTMKTTQKHDVQRAHFMKLGMSVFKKIYMKVIFFPFITSTQHFLNAYLRVWN